MVSLFGFSSSYKSSGIHYLQLSSSELCTARRHQGRSAALNIAQRPAKHQSSLVVSQRSTRHLFSSVCFLICLESKLTALSPLRASLCQPTRVRSWYSLAPMDVVKAQP